MNDLLQPFSQVKTQATNTIWQSDLFLFFPPQLWISCHCDRFLRKISLLLLSSPHRIYMRLVLLHLFSMRHRPGQILESTDLSSRHLYLKALFSQTNPVLLVKKLREKKTCETWDNDKRCSDKGKDDLCLSVC